METSLKIGRNNRPLDLRKFEETNRYKEKITYQPESFPGLVIKKNKLTYVVFTSGSVNIVGGKSKKQILEGIPLIKRILPKLEVESESEYE